MIDRYRRAGAKKVSSCVIRRCAIVLLAAGASAPQAFGQAPGVEIVRDRGEVRELVKEKAIELRESGSLLSLEDIQEQLTREQCNVNLPQTANTPLSVREIWRRAKASHLRIGWLYLCKRCDKWHTSLAGGYFITADGVAATCHHVVAKDKDAYREGYLVAVDDSGNVLPVLEVMASNVQTDTAIVRLKPAGPVTALPLNADTYPGDAVWCYSDPLGRSGYFSEGIINRFYMAKENDVESPRIEVSTDWAPGSSGAAVLDRNGNAVGHVSQISAVGTGRMQPSRGSVKDDKKSSKKSGPPAPMIVFHCAARAHDVLALVDGNKD